MQEQTEVRPIIETALETLAFAAGSGAADRLTELALLLAGWGARINLSGHRTPTAIAGSLIADAVGLLAALEEAIEKPLTGRVADLGSGAGFPGLPIAVIRGSCEVFLVEGRERRHYFQRAARRQIQISNATPLLARIEDVPVTDTDFVIAQAVGPATDVVALMRAYGRPSTALIVPGSDTPPCPDGVEDLETTTIHYQAPITDRSRTLWIGVLPPSPS